jgi:ribonucleotide monophosphatase NagD (HAD superfamily)
MLQVKINSSLHPAVKGVLFDLEGVLYVGSHAIEGAVEVVERIRTSGMACRFVTNISTLSLASLQLKINALGFLVPAREIISASQAALLYLRCWAYKFSSVLPD